MRKQKGTLRQRVRDTTAEALLEAAERAMVKRGYDNTTMAQIAAEAGCATGTFYLYFKNKEQLLHAIFAKHGQALFESARSALHEMVEPLEKIRRSVQCHLCYVHEHEPFFRLFFTAMPIRFRRLRTELGPGAQKHRDDYSTLELEVLRQAQRKGQIRKDLPAELLQQFMEAVGTSVVEEFLFSDCKQSVQQQTDTIWGLITGGLGIRSCHERS